MCNGSMIMPCKTCLAMEDASRNNQEGLHHKISILLEFSASDDIIGFKDAVEKKGHDVCEVGFWYGRGVNSKEMRYEERTPLMIAAMFGSKNVLSYILGTRKIDVNQACGSDGATALHCAVAGGSSTSPEVIKLLLNSSANVNAVDANGNRSCDLIDSVYNSIFNSRKKALEAILEGYNGLNHACLALNEAVSPLGMQERLQDIDSPRISMEKRDYAADLSLPDINNGMYSTDEFRMYTFKVKPCSRPYSHDWTECPFVHPGENARRRDPKKYHYSCVPCPEFRKGSCRKGDSCEYAHGIFECWLHPAQYRTRLCKDETECPRRVCFFAHTREELRPLYASTGSALPSPTSHSSDSSSSSSSFEMGSVSTFILGSPCGGSSPTRWHTHQPHVTVPTLQLPKSRFKKSVNARDVDLDIKLIGIENRRLMQQQMIDDISGLPPSSKWRNSAPNSPSFQLSPGLKPTNHDDLYVSQLKSPNATRVHQNLNQHMQGYSSNLSTSNVIGSPQYRVDQSVSESATTLNSRNAGCSERSQNYNSLTSSKAMESSSTLFGWGSPDGKLDWSIYGEKLNKTRNSASFGLRSNTNPLTMATTPILPDVIDEYDASWVNSLVKDGTQHRELERSIPSWF